MIRIAVTAEAFDAIAATLPLGSIGFERHPADDGQRLVWLERSVVNRLRALRGPGESYSDDILRLVELRGQQFLNQNAIGPLDRGLRGVLARWTPSG
jgi:hypothetical protein